MKKIMELKSVSAGYHDQVVLRDASLTVYEKDFIGIIGPNGGGKTTLLRVILGIIRPFRGEIIIHDQSLRSNRIGYLPQFKDIDREFPITVRDIVLSGLMNSKRFMLWSSREEKKMADAILERFKLLHLSKKPVGELSGGQMQRTFLCRALVSSPRLLILDEPDTFADSESAQNLNETLSELNKNMSIILVSHDIGAILPAVKNIACINERLYYHNAREFSKESMESLSCPVRLLGHGNIPHTVLKTHGDNR